MKFEIDEKTGLICYQENVIISFIGNTITFYSKDGTILSAKLTKLFDIATMYDKHITKLGPIPLYKILKAVKKTQIELK